MPLLETKHLGIAFGGLRALEDVNFKLEENQIMGLIGPNGAGKTTTFYMIVGLNKPNEGQIFLEDDNGQVAELTKEPV